MVVQYLAVCPQRGREAARALLPYLCSHTDRSVMAVAQLLVEEADWADESSALLRARGMWWLARCVSPPLTSSSGLQSVLIGSTLAKAATFFQAAGDTPRVEALLEASLSRCMWAVASATHAFTGLEIRPTASGPFRPQLPSICDRARSPEDRMAELEGALLEAGELLQAVSADGGADSIVERCCRCLDVYVSAVQVRFAPSLDASSLRSAAAQLAGLVTDQPDYPALPAR